MKQQRNFELGALLIHPLNTKVSRATFVARSNQPLLLSLIVMMGISSFAYGEPTAMPCDHPPATPVMDEPCNFGSGGGYRHTQFTRDGRSKVVGEATELAARGRSSAEMTIKDKKFIRKENQWFLESQGKWYQVASDTVSIKFRPGITVDERRQFFKSQQLEVVRTNRLGIFDVRIMSKKNALELFSDLQGHSLIDYVEIHTMGVYEGP
ncbi:hypothetical protein [Nitrospira sp. M1]